MKIRTLKGGEAKKGKTIRLFDVAEFSVYDGPGVRVVVYFQGCHVRCTWCHSPHSQTTESPLMFNANSCTNCGLCVHSCQNKAHSIVKNRHHINRKACTGCGECIKACPNSITGVKGSALHLPTVETTTEALFDQISPYIQLSEGGVTLSGGEALLQSEAAKELLLSCKENGYHTAVETSGLLSPRIYESVIPLVDVWLLGMRVITGNSQSEYNYNRIMQTLQLLVSGQARILPRIPMVPGYFDQDHVLDFISALLKKHSIKEVCLNPWNKHFDVNYLQSGIPLVMPIPTTEEIKICETKIRKHFVNLNFIIYGNNEA